MTHAVKRYAPTRSGTPAPRRTFIVVFLRDGVEEEHEFTAVPRLSYADMVGMGLGMHGEGHEGLMLTTMDRALRRALVDDDGTPARWRPEITERGTFTDPNGDEVPEDLLPQYTAFEAGSSRRRWAALMDDDDEVTVEIEQIGELFRDLIREASAGRPTKR